jgi:hypothetical protein
MISFGVFMLQRLIGRRQRSGETYFCHFQLLSWRQYGSPKRWHQHTSLRGVKTQNIVIIIVNAVKTWSINTDSGIHKASRSFCCSYGWGNTTSLNFGHQWAYCSSPSWYVSMESYGGMIMAGETGGSQRKKKPVPVPLYHKSHADWPKQKPGRPWWGQQLTASSMAWPSRSFLSGPSDRITVHQITAHLRNFNNKNICVPRLTRFSWSAPAVEATHSVNACSTIEASSTCTVIYVDTAVRASPPIHTYTGETTDGVGASGTILAHTGSLATFIYILLTQLPHVSRWTQAWVTIYIIHTRSPILAQVAWTIINILFTVLTTVT